MTAKPEDVPTPVRCGLSFPEALEVARIQLGGNLRPSRGHAMGWTHARVSTFDKKALLAKARKR